MIKTKNKYHSIKFVLILIVTIVFIFSGLQVNGGTSSELRKIQIQSSIKKIQDNIDAIGNNLEDGSMFKSSLVEQQKSLQTEIDQTESAITEARLLSNNIQNEIDQKESQKAELVSEMKFVLINLQKQQSIGIVEQILTSKNLSEAISASYNMSSLQLKAESLRRTLEQNTQDLLEVKKNQDANLKQIIDLNFYLRSKRSGLENLLNQYKGREDLWQGLLKSLDEQKKLRQIELSSIEAEQLSVKNQQNSSGGSTQNNQLVNSDGTCWFEETKPLVFPQGYFIKPAEGVISRVLDGCKHDAADIANSIGTHIIATANGSVYKKGYDPTGYGNYIMLKHTLPSGDRVYSIYAHLNSQSILAVDDIVNQGDLIGYMGTTGNSTGPHTHFGIISESLETSSSIGCRNGGKNHSMCYDPSKLMDLYR